MYMYIYIYIYLVPCFGCSFHSLTTRCALQTRVKTFSALRFECIVPSMSWALNLNMHDASVKCKVVVDVLGVNAGASSLSLSSPLSLFSSFLFSLLSLLSSLSSLSSLLCLLSLAAAAAAVRVFHCCLSRQLSSASLVSFSLHPSLARDHCCAAVRSPFCSWGFCAVQWCAVCALSRPCFGGCFADALHRWAPLV